MIHSILALALSLIFISCAIAAPGQKFTFTGSGLSQLVFVYNGRLNLAGSPACAPSNNSCLVASGFISYDSNAKETVSYCQDQCAKKIESHVRFNMYYSDSGKKILCMPNVVVSTYYSVLVTNPGGWYYIGKPSSSPAIVTKLNYRYEPLQITCGAKKYTVKVVNNKPYYGVHIPPNVAYGIGVISITPQASD